MKHGQCKIEIDGRDNYNFPGIDEKDVTYIIRGDSFIPSIQAASIIAKVSRDELMTDLDTLYPGYEFSKHK